MTSHKAHLNALFCTFMAYNKVAPFDHVFEVNGKIVPEYELLTQVIDQDPEVVDALIAETHGKAVRATCGRVMINNEPVPLSRLWFVREYNLEDYSSDNASEYLYWMQAAVQAGMEASAKVENTLKEVSDQMREKALRIGSYCVESGNIFISNDTTAITTSDHMKALGNVLGTTPEQMSIDVVKDFFDRNIQFDDAKVVLTALPNNLGKGDISLSSDFLLFTAINKDAQSLFLRVGTFGPAITLKLLGDSLLKVDNTEDGLMCSYNYKFIAYALTRIGKSLANSIDAAKEAQDEKA